MKIYALCIACALYTTLSFSQQEFTTHDNGLIYNEVTMSKLTSIVDSLNLKYKSCEINPVFKSQLQTIGKTMTLETGDIAQARKDLDNNISFAEFISKYPEAIIDDEVLIVRHQYTNYADEEIVDFTETTLNSSRGLSIKNDINTKKGYQDLKGTWLYSYNSKTKYSKESLKAFYFPNAFESKTLSKSYNKQIAYSECLIDTTSTKFKKNAKMGYVDMPENWQNLSIKKKEKLLSKLRSTQVVGSCSMDDSPRLHAVNIALLSAETTNWEVFLKSHLDIMNDRFDRMSDGSYAYAQRNTYIKELEELNINVHDLIMGITLRIENPTTNHYYGSIGRLGRAISESNNKDTFKTQMLNMIEDDSLDYFNRVIAYYLFLNFNNYLESEMEQKENLTLLDTSTKHLPDFMQRQIQAETN